MSSVGTISKQVLINSFAFHQVGLVPSSTEIDGG